VDRILVIVQRSNGDVFLSKSLIDNLQNSYKGSKLDLLINDDTYAIASLFENINKIIQFSYREKKTNPIKQELRIIKKIYQKYDLAISLTASDRSNLYAILSAKKSISAVENDLLKSWWKRIFNSEFYIFNSYEHILVNNLKPLELLDIAFRKELQTITLKENSLEKAKKKFQKYIGNFVIFHPCAQYEYKIYPEKSRNKLLEKLSDLGIYILVTGSSSEIDLGIKRTIPVRKNIINLIGKISLEEYLILSSLSKCFIGMDTLNMHIAASQNKKIFAIFGPTILKMWSPWSNSTNSCASINQQVNKYGNVTIFQADLPCVACGNMGCNNEYDESACLNHIDPEIIYKEVKNFLND